MMEHGSDLVMWGWVLLLSGGLGLAIFVYLMIWRERYRRPASAEPLVRIQGRVAEPPGTVVYCVDGGEPIISRPFRVEGEGRRSWVVDPSGSVLAIRGYRSGRRLIRGLIAGEQVTIDGLPTTIPKREGLYRDVGRIQGIEAVRIAGGAWPQMRWLRIPLALTAVLFLVSLAHVVGVPGPAPLRERLERTLVLRTPPPCATVGGARFTPSSALTRSRFEDQTVYGLGRLIGDPVGPAVPQPEDRLTYLP